MNNSLYEEVKNDLAERKCDTCAGSGKCNDAELGDIFFRTWICKSCDGNGFKHSVSFILVENESA